MKPESLNTKREPLKRRKRRRVVRSKHSGKGQRRQLTLHRWRAGTPLSRLSVLGRPRHRPGGLSGKREPLKRRKWRRVVRSKHSGKGRRRQLALQRREL